MTYHGRIKNGVVVLDGPAPAEGTAVRVEPLDSDAESAGPGSAAAILKVAGTWAGDPAEVDRLLTDLREMKKDELDNQGGAPDENQLRP